MWRSLVAHLLWEQRAAGSNPVTPTGTRTSTSTTFPSLGEGKFIGGGWDSFKDNNIHSSVAQLAEQPAVNRCVEGSSPS